jgi:hypothetical protein
VTREDQIVAYLRWAERAGHITRAERLAREGRLLLASMRKAGLIAPGGAQR